MYRIIVIIIVSLFWMSHEQLLAINWCCDESAVSNFTMEACLDYPCTFSGGNVTDDQHELIVTEEDEMNSGLEHVNSTDSRLDDETLIESISEWSQNFNDSDFYMLPDGVIRFNNYSGKTFPLSPYYYCNESTPSKDSGRISIKCPCENVTYFNQCCPPGYMLFEKDEEVTWFSECTLKVEGTLNEYLKNLPEGHEPYILHYNHFNHSLAEKLLEKVDKNYLILVDPDEDFDKTNEGLKLESMNFKPKYVCDIQDIVVNNSRHYQELTCVKDAYEAPYPKFYEAITYLCIIFYGMTIIVFLLIPKLRTMKSNIIICQSISFVVMKLVDIQYNRGGWKPSYAECMTTAYMLHFCNLAGGFWINVMSFDLALTFSGRRIFQRTKGKRFLLYSLYGWGCPLIIVLVTAILGFAVELPEGYLKPEMNLEYCWFQDLEPMWAYHYGPVLFLTCVNGPLLGYAVYNISKGICSARVLHKAGSGLHIGKNVKKKGRTRMIIYFNLALLIGCPRVLSFIKLLTRNELVRLLFNSTNLLRAFFIFMFVCCKPKVFVMLKKQICLKISGKTARSETTSSTKTSDSVISENISTQL